MVGKGSSMICMFGWFAMFSRIEMLFDGVMMTVTLMFLTYRAFKKFSNGRVWP